MDEPNRDARSRFARLTTGLVYMAVGPLVGACWFLALAMLLDPTILRMITTSFSGEIAVLMLVASYLYGAAPAFAAGALLWRPTREPGFLECLWIGAVSSMLWAASLGLFGFGTLLGLTASPSAIPVFLMVGSCGAVSAVVTAAILRRWRASRAAVPVAGGHTGV